MCKLGKYSTRLLYLLTHEKTSTLAVWGVILSEIFSPHRVVLMVCFVVPKFKKEEVMVEQGKKKLVAQDKKVKERKAQEEQEENSRCRGVH